MEERNCLEGETRVREEVTQLSSNERRHVFSTYSHLSDSHSSVRKSKSHYPEGKSVTVLIVSLVSFPMCAAVAPTIIIRLLGKMIFFYLFCEIFYEI